MLRHAVTAVAVLALGACQQDPGPRQTLETFLQSIADDKAEVARALLVASERDGRRMPFDRAGLEDGFTIRSVEFANGRAEATVAMESKSPVPVRFVLAQEHDGWRVSLVETVLATLGGTPGELAQRLEAEEGKNSADTRHAAPPGGR